LNFKHEGLEVNWACSWAVAVAKVVSLFALISANFVSTALQSQAAAGFGWGLASSTSAGAVAGQQYTTTWGQHSAVFDSVVESWLQLTNVNPMASGNSNARNICFMIRGATKFWFASWQMNYNYFYTKVNRFLFHSNWRLLL
jgi:hypothetical protein